MSLCFLKVMLALVESCKQTKNKKIMSLLFLRLSAFVDRQHECCCIDDFSHCRVFFDLNSQDLTLFLASIKILSEQNHAKWLNNVVDLHKLVFSKLFELEIFQLNVSEQLKFNVSISISTCVWECAEKSDFCTL